MLATLGQAAILGTAIVFAARRVERGLVVGAQQHGDRVERGMVVGAQQHGDRVERGTVVAAQQLGDRVEAGLKTVGSDSLRWPFMEGKQAPKG